MIPNFKTYIEEGLWSKGVERSQTGESRLGEKTIVDRFMDYVKTIEWQDMSCDILFAKYDFPEMLCIEDIIKIQNKLPKDIRIAGDKEFDFIERTCIFEVSENTDDNECIDAISGEFENDEHFISFNLYKDVRHKDRFKEQVHYYKKHKEYNKDEWYVFYDVVFPPGNQDHRPIGLTGFGTCILEKNITDYKTLCIKLVKDKPLSEGLWSKGVSRSKTGEARQEDLSEFDLYFKNIEWIDLGDENYLFSKKDFPFEVTKETIISLEEIEKIIKSLPEDIVILDNKRLDYINDKFLIYLKNKTLILNNKRSKEEMTMNYRCVYWISDFKHPMDICDYYICATSGTNLTSYNIKYNKEDIETNMNGCYTNKSYCIKLMKKKKREI